MPKLGLEQIIEMQPEPAAVRSRRRRQWLADNWLPLAMFLAWAVGQAWGGGQWVFARQHNDDELASQVEQLRAALAATAATYVRQDVFGAELRAINTRLESIDRKLDRR
jgi:hypothetical protein